MLELVGGILIVIVASAIILYLNPSLASKLVEYLKAFHNKPPAVEPVTHPDLNALNCRVRLTAEYNSGSPLDVLVIEIFS